MKMRTDDDEEKKRQTGRNFSQHTHKLRRMLHYPHICK